MHLSPFVARVLPGIVLAAALPACAGQSSGVSSFTPQVRNAAESSTPKSVPATTLLHIFAANRNTNSLLAFKFGASGDVRPEIKIGGIKTKLQLPDALAVDSSGYVYTANDGATQVEVFAPGATGDVKPARIIGGSHSQLGPTEGILIDPSGNLWVSSYTRNAITEYAPGAKGDVLPIDTIAGSNTQLSTP